MITFILAISVLLQFTAAVMAMRLIPLTGRKTAWSFIAVALMFMALRRSIPLVRILSGDGAIQPDFSAETVALVISILMFVGISRIGPIFAARKEAEELLGKAKHEWATIFQAIGHAAVVLAPDHSIIAANRAILRMTGMAEQDILGRKCYEVFHPETLSPPEDCPLKRLLISGSMENLDTEINALGGIFHIRCTPVRDDFGQLQRVIYVATDVTEHKRAEADLRESEARYRGLVEKSRDLIYTTDGRGVLTYVNPALEKTLGYTKGELIGQPFARIAAPGFIETARDIFRRAMHGEAVPVYEGDLIRKDGTEIYVEFNVTTLFDTEGKPSGRYGVGRDITERKKAEEERREYELRLASIINFLPDPTLAIDMEGKVIAWNRAMEDMTGIRSEEMLGKGNYEYALPFYGKRRPILIDFIFSWDEEVEKQYSFINREGDTLYTETAVPFVRGVRGFLWGKASPLYDIEGNIVGAIESIRDVTERKRVEEEIKEYSEDLERMVEERTQGLNRALFDSHEARDRIDWILKSVADGLIVTDDYNRVVLMNRAAEDLLGVRLSDVIDRSIDYAIDDEILRERIRTTLEKREPGYQFDFELPGENDAHLRIMRARTSVIEDMEGRHTGIITIIQDVTHERELDRMKAEFISTAAHELRTPLTSIQGFSELLMSRDDITEGERTRFLTYINSRSKALAAIIDDLLDISRIESGKGFALKKISSDMEKIVRDAVSYFESASAVHEFVMDFPGEPVKLMVDPEKMEQAVSNIFSNAVKYSPGGGTISVTGTVTDNFFQVSITDEGIGMTPEQVKQIFDKFYRADSSTTAVEGTGLGMSIVKYIIEAHGGTVRVESESDKGTKVTVAIPLRSQGNRESVAKSEIY